MWACDLVRPNRDRWASVAFGMPIWDIWALVWTWSVSESS